ncbi:hypothetical protein P8452_63963 [Trifolium repens]|nr:hypothetical protein P8452_63963 [Trifolium repens]
MQLENTNNTFPLVRKPTDEFSSLQQHTVEGGFNSGSFHWIREKQSRFSDEDSEGCKRVSCEEEFEEDVEDEGGIGGD